MRNGPDLWLAVLNAIGLHWQPVVAGGCIRDHHLGLEPKDIDVFVPANDDRDFLSILDGIGHLGHGQITYFNPAFDTGGEFGQRWSEGDKSLVADCEYENDAESDLVATWEGEIIGVPVNIIGRRSLAADNRSLAGRQTRRIENLINGFDFDVVRVAYDEYGYVGASKFGGAFMEAIQNRKATLCHDRTYSQSLRRFERFNKRNPGVLTLVDPFNSQVF